MQTLESQKDILDQQTLDLLMTYNPENALSHIARPNPYTHNLIHLGNKGFNLMTLHRDGLPVPPAFVITTEVFRCRSVILDFSRAWMEFMEQVRTALTSLEEQTGRRFGDPRCAATAISAKRQCHLHAGNDGHCAQCRTQ